MSRISASVATTGIALLLLAAATPAQNQTVSQTQPQAQTSLSTVRIVRLSEVRGAVQLDRGAGQEFEQAMVNMPVVQQSRLKTAMGVAEVEFEDNSTLRLGPNSEVIFYVLGRTDKGNTVSSVRLQRGVAYVSLVKSSGRVANEFNLAFGGQRDIQLRPDTHVRLEIDGQQAKLAVLGGSVQLNAPSGAIDVSRKNTATFALASDSQPTVAKGIASDSLLDTWDKQLDQYHSKVASLTNFGGVPYNYGVSDMLYYGAFQNEGSCGMMWRPYFASMAWDPYANGTWASYGGAGYSWVSPYPWGWTPYHYGSWSFCPGAGYGWVPGGSWMGVNNVAAASSKKLVSGVGIVKLPRVTPQPPRVGGPSLVSVNRTALVRSGLDREGSFVFRKDSAGLGIPRDELGNLRGFSKHADQRGMATTPIYVSTTPGTNGMRGVSMRPAPVAIHRGYSPSYGGARSSASTSSSTSTTVSTPTTTSMPSAHVSGGGGRH